MHEKLEDPVPAPAADEMNDETCTCSCKTGSTDRNPTAEKDEAQTNATIVHTEINDPPG